MKTFLVIIVSVLMTSSASAFWWNVVDPVHPPREVSAERMSDFSSDGCSKFPEGFSKKDPNRWAHCCIAHDIAYWIGGESELRDAADEELNKCVSDSTHVSLGWIMEQGVIMGGTAYLPTNWRWAYGWKKKQNYTPLTEDQLQTSLNNFHTILTELNRWKNDLTREQRGYIVTKVLEKYEEVARLKKSENLVCPLTKEFEDYSFF